MKIEPKNTLYIRVHPDLDIISAVARIFSDFSKDLEELYPDWAPEKKTKLILDDTLTQKAMSAFENNKLAATVIGCGDSTYGEKHQLLLKDLKKDTGGDTKLIVHCYFYDKLSASERIRITASLWSRTASLKSDAWEAWKAGSKRISEGSVPLATLKRLVNSHPGARAVYAYDYGTKIPSIQAVILPPSYNPPELTKVTYPHNYTFDDSVELKKAEFLE